MTLQILSDSLHISRSARYVRFTGELTIMISGILPVTLRRAKHQSADLEVCEETLQQSHSLMQIAMVHFRGSCYK